MLENRNERWIRYKKELSTMCTNKKIPFNACFEFTPLCNFNCNMCYVHLTTEQAAKQGKMLSTEQWLEMGRQAQKMGTLFLELTGGEALTRKDFPLLYSALVDMGFLITLRSNGYMLTDEILALLTKKKPRHISITIYGASDETYQKVCGVKDGFTVVSKNVEKLIAAGIDVRLTITKTKNNEDDVVKIKEWAKKIGKNVEVFGGIFQPREGTERKVNDVRLTFSDEDCEITDDMKFRKYPESTDISRTELFSGCKNFGAKYCITWNGHLTVCNGFTYIWENPFVDNLESAYKRLYERLYKLKKPKECADCKYFDFCIACPVNFVSETGDPQKTCENICRIARYYYKKALLITDDKESSEKELPMKMECD